MLFKGIFERFCPYHQRIVAHRVEGMADMASKKIIERLLAVSAAFLLGSTGASASTICGAEYGDPMVGKAEQLLQQNKSRQAYAYLNVARGLGSGEAYRVTADMYQQGRGVMPDPGMFKHMSWMGAQHGDPESMFRTAQDFYDHGYRKDGEYWAKAAHACGHGGALMLLFERSVADKRDADARHYLEKGIDAGLVAAKLALAEQYDKGGLGLPKDTKRAFYWYYEAAKLGEAKAMSAVAYYFFRGLHGVLDETAAVHWYHEAAKAGHVESMTAYGWMLANGRGTQKDSSEAKRYFLKAKKLGEKNVDKFLSELNANGKFADTING